MINLESSAKLYGSAAVSSAISYTLSGVENQNGVLTNKILGQGLLSSNAAVLYTVPTGRTAVINSIMLNNETYNSVSFIRFYINGTGSGKQISIISIPPNGTALFNDDGWSIYDHNGLKLESTVNANNYFP